MSDDQISEALEPEVVRECDQISEALEPEVAREWRTLERTMPTPTKTTPTTVC
jgi:hypothetical protein